MHNHIHHLFNELTNALLTQATAAPDLLQQSELNTIASEVDGLQHDYAELTANIATITNIR